MELWEPSSPLICPCRPPAGLYMSTLALLASVSFLLGFFITLAFTRWLIAALRKRGLLVPDYHKREQVLVPRPGGPAIIAGLVAGSLPLLGLLDRYVLAFVLTTLLAGTIGLVDDFRKLGGRTKPLVLLLTGAPILLLGAYSPHPHFPLFGPVRLSIIYPLLVPIALTVTSNAFNALDVLNGVVSLFTVIASLPLLAYALLKGNMEGFFISLLLVAVSLGFYVYHKYPSRIFPGDSGSLTLGAAYGAAAIMGKAEVIAIVAMLPAIFNTFFYLFSVKGFLEHSLVKDRPVEVRDGLLHSSKNSRAPLTLLRLILVEEPMSERTAARRILMVAAYTAFLALLTAFLTP